MKISNWFYKLDLETNYYWKWLNYQIMNLLSLDFKVFVRKSGIFIRWWNDYRNFFHLFNVVIYLLYYHYPNLKAWYRTDWTVFQPCLFNHNSLFFGHGPTHGSAEGKKQIFNSFLFAAAVVNTSTVTLMMTL